MAQSIGGLEEIPWPPWPLFRQGRFEINLKLHANPEIFKLGVLYHAWELWALFQFDYPDCVRGKCLELSRRKVNYRVGEELSFALELDPFDVI